MCCLLHSTNCFIDFFLFYSPDFAIILSQGQPHAKFLSAVKKVKDFFSQVSAIFYLLFLVPILKKINSYFLLLCHSSTEVRRVRYMLAVEMEKHVSTSSLCMLARSLCLFYSSHGKCHTCSQFVLTLRMF